MTEKRFISKGGSIINVATDELVNASSEESAEIIVMWLNEQHETIHQLSLRISEIATKYTLLKEFSSDTNPNDAVKHIIHELMMNTKELRR